MSTPQPAVDPVMEAWIEEQMKHFKPGDLDNAVHVWRQIRRRKAAAAQKGAAA